MRVLVCGGREFGSTELERALFENVMQMVLGNQARKGRIIHGAARGADELAGKWANANEWIELRFPADWQWHGKAAGAIRNQIMLHDATPNLVIAFPGGRGTADMVRRARKAGVPVLRVVP